MAGEAAFGHLWNPQGELSSTGLSSFDSSSTTYPRPVLPTDICYKPHIQVTFIAGTLNSKKKGQGLPWWLSGKDSACLCRIRGFDPWSGKTPRAAEQLSPMCHKHRACALQLGDPQLRSTHALQLLKPLHLSACSATREAAPGRSSSSSKASAQPEINTEP